MQKQNNSVHTSVWAMKRKVHNSGQFHWSGHSTEKAIWRRNDGGQALLSLPTT